MPRTTIEEASACPRCGEPGTHTTSTAGPKGSTIRTYICENTRCRWFEQGGWVVQVNADGTVPVRSKGEKEFAPLTEGQKAMARRQIEDIMQEDLRNRES